MAGVPFVDLNAQHAPIREELTAALDRVLDANGYILGEDVDLFEQEFAAYCGAEHCVGVGSGTAALQLMIEASGIGHGDEVIVPAHTYIASALGVVHAGATPVFCEVDEGTGLIDVDAAADAVSERTAAILAVHLYGQVCDMEAVRELAGRHGLAVFEDAAQAHGASRGGQRAGSFGTAGFSFYPSKNLGALGDGGAICTADAEVAERARWLRHLGQRSKGEHAVIGYNQRLDGLQAAFLRAKLPHLDGWNAARRERAADYREQLPDGLRLLDEAPGTEPVYHLFPVRTPDRDGLAARLGDAGIGTGVHYHPSVPAQPPFLAGGDPDRFPIAQAWAAQELSLPMFEHMRREQVEQVAAACADAVRAAA